MRDGWAASTPEQVDLDPRGLCSLVDWLDHLPGSNIHSVLVARRARLAFEHYRVGADERWQTSLPEASHGPTVKHDLRSATKGITGLLVGIALERKLIPSVNEPVFRSEEHTSE